MIFFFILVIGLFCLQKCFISRIRISDIKNHFLILENITFKSQLFYNIRKYLKNFKRRPNREIIRLNKNDYLKKCLFKKKSFLLVFLK